MLLILITFILEVTVVFFLLIWRLINNFINMCPFYYKAVAGSGKVGIRLLTSVTRTNRAKSVRNIFLRSCNVDLSHAYVLCFSERILS